MNHIFWSTPQARPFFPTVPLRMGGRFVGAGGFFMSQPTGNRLDAISIPAIIGRIQLAPGVLAYLDFVKQQAAKPPDYRQGWQSRQGWSPPRFPGMSEAEKAALLEIQKNPTSEELADLATIDSAFTAYFTKLLGLTTAADVCYQLKHPPLVISGGGQGRPITMPHEPIIADSNLLAFLEQQLPEQLREQELQNIPPFYGPAKGLPPPPSPKKDYLAFTNDKFYCTNPDNPATGIADFSYLFGQWFGIDNGAKWGTVKLAVENALVVVNVWGSFPFPPPIDQDRGFFWGPVLPDLPKLANIGSPIDPDAVKIWMTLATIEFYDQISTNLENYLKKKAREAKRRAMITAIAAAVVGLAASFLLPAIIAAAVSMIKTAVDTYTEIQKRKKAAKAMMDASKMFEKDAPAFAAEAKKTAEILDEATAIQEASRPRTPEEQAALDEIPSSPTNLIVPGTIAAGVVGAAAFLL